MTYRETAMTLLHLDSSILGEASASRQLTRAIVAQWKAEHPGGEVVYRDLAAQELPHLSGAAFMRRDELEAARNDAVLQEFLRADVVVVGAPLYNFSIPSQLKAWIDRIAVKGMTFRYTPSGPEGLAGGKRVIVAVARGSVYGEDAGVEFGESYLRFMFRFLGIEDLSFVRAEGLGISPQHRADALAAAHAAIQVRRVLAA
jgi:FMN-dependent NADH-azoreductase